MRVGTWVGWAIGVVLVVGYSPASGQFPGKKKPIGGPETEVAAPSDAEQIAQLRRSIETAQLRLTDLTAERNDPMGEYAQAEAEFQNLEAELDRLKKALLGLPDDGTPERAAARAKLQDEVIAQEKAHELAKERFDLAIEERKTLKEQIAALEQKIKSDREALDHLTGDDEPVEAKKADTPSEPEAGTMAAHDPKTKDASDAETKGDEAKGKGEEKSEGEEDEADDEVMLRAREEERVNAEAAREAEAEERSINERLIALDKSIALEQKLLATDRKKADNAQQTKNDAADEFRTRSLNKASTDELNKLNDRIRKADRRYREAQEEVHNHSDRVAELQAERADLITQQLAAAKKTEEANAKKEEAQAHIDVLMNPFHPRNLIPWVVERGPRILLLVVMMVVLNWGVQRFCRRIVEAITRRTARGSKEEREGRAETLVGVFHNAASLVILGAGGMMILQEAGVPVAPLLGGAAVFGLAVAFGAQNLIRDYFYGFVILMENQYKLNDVVKLGSLSGSVEKITLRMTVLRDGEGSVHFVPNGQINSVTNLTHGWSRAVVDVGVSYQEDIDRVIAILTEIGLELRKDPEFAPSILEDPTMLGVESMSDSAVVVKFFLKTKTLRQWPVRRELLRRIKNRFDREGIAFASASPAVVVVRADDAEWTGVPRGIVGLAREETKGRASA